MVQPLASPPVLFHVVLSRRCRLSRQLVAVVGGSATRSLRWVQAVYQDRSQGRCMIMRCAPVATRHGIWMRVGRTVAVLARARAGVVRVARRLDRPWRGERCYRAVQ